MFASFSICVANRSSTSSRMPAASPASTIEMYRREKTFGCRARAWERSAPPSTSVRTSATTDARYASVVWSSRILSDATTFRPASIIVANWREKAWSARGFTFFMKLLAGASASAPAEAPRRLSGSSSRSSARSPRTRSCSRAASSVGACTSPASSRPSELIAV
jgi:hypothetical protein